MLVHQSSTRRKSCSGCVKAKRRCDLRLPRCSRCQKQKLNCSFAQVWEERIAQELFQVEAQPTERRKSKEVASMPVFQNRPSSFPLVPSDGSAALQVPDTRFDFDTTTTSTIITPGGLQDLNQFLSSPNEISTTADHASSMQSYMDVDLRDIDFSTFPNDSNMCYPDLCTTSTILSPSIRSLQYPTIVSLNQSQLDHSLKHIQSCIPSLVKAGNASFIYDIFNQNCPLWTVHSRAIYQDILTICSLQTCKNQRNTSAITSIVNCKISSLITSSPETRPFLDLLASVQALIVYQIIRLFDSDPEQRSIAERQSIYLYTWSTKLQTYHSPYQQYITTENLSPWQEWIVSESVRRTVMMSVLLKACYNSVKFGTCEDVPVLSRLPVSDKGSFWRLGEEEWKERLEIDGEVPKLFPYKRFVEEWENGNVRDVDEFGTALLICCVGVSETGVGV